jgi:hypothetical protein
MSRAAETNANEVLFLERRKEVRIVCRIPGRFSLANRRDTNGNRRQFACRAVNVSQSTMVLAAPVTGAAGERVITYFEEFGKLDGAIMRTIDGGFVMKIVVNSSERNKLLDKLIWLEMNKNLDVPDNRRQKRVVPQDPHSTLILADGSMLGCFVIDISASGAAVSADIIPKIGTLLSIGKVLGKVVRHFEEGFAVGFNQIQDAYTIERDVIHKW